MRSHLPVVHWLVDGLLWAVAIPVAVWVRYDFDADRVTGSLFRTVALAMVLQGVIGFGLGQYRRKWRYGSFDEVRYIAFTAGLVGLLMTVLLWWDTSIPRSIPALAAAFALCGQVAARSAWRSYVAHTQRPSGPDVKRLVVVGAGEAARQIVQTLLATKDSHYLPVALVDDDPNKRNLRFSGVRVGGSVDELGLVARAYHADAVLIAVPTADGSFVRHVDDLASAEHLDVLVLPPVERLFGQVGEDDIRPVSTDDFLGRPPAEIDPVAIAGYVTGRRVLVTGAGGSIGSELCRQLLRFEPGVLLMLDRDESGLHATQLSIEGRAMLDDPSLLLADIRDATRIDEVFASHRPDIVFHAAALKHLPLLEMHPAEGWKTNVGGTHNLLESARRHGVDLFVNVSTDKAANPSSVLGWTKRITERMTAHASHEGPTTCVSVRFGNVLGSNGSVLKAFEVQAANGGPLTVTHPEITRYFMTIEEASRLIVHAGAIGESGEVMILDMGEPVRILDVAERIASHHTPALDIAFTGLRPNEKLHEDLISTDEVGERRSHTLITHVAVPPLAPPATLHAGDTLSVAQIRSIAVSDVVVTSVAPGVTGSAAHDR